jgi:hypothetical protein
VGVETSPNTRFAASAGNCAMSARRRAASCAAVSCAIAETAKRVAPKSPITAPTSRIAYPFDPDFYGKNIECCEINH